LAASADSLAKAPTLSDFRRPSYTVRRESSASVRTGSVAGSPIVEEAPYRGFEGSSPTTDIPEGISTDSTMNEKGPSSPRSPKNEVIQEERLSSGSHPSRIANRGESADTTTANGGLPEYRPPPSRTWKQATVAAFKASVKFTLTPLGFFIVIYGLNVVAWGGMLFLLLCNASPAMDHPSSNAINSPRRIWIEIDSQILNALFCVTGFGLIPWRFRDFYYLLKWRVWKRQDALRRLAGIHRSWFRLPGSDKLPLRNNFMGNEGDISNEEENPALPLPVSKAPDDPPTGVRAPPTKLWKLDYVIWAFVWNKFLQVVLSSFMWHYNRYTRPSWSTGLFVAMACIVAALGGIMIWREGKAVKKVEGVLVTGDDDIEKGDAVQESEKEKNESEKGTLSKKFWKRGPKTDAAVRYPPVA
jgi:hypothetical protein